MYAPGTLHLTLYDGEVHHPTDNAYAGIYLGEVLPLKAANEAP